MVMATCTCPLLPAASLAVYVYVTTVPGSPAVSDSTEILRLVSTPPSSESTAVAAGLNNGSPDSTTRARDGGGLMTGGVRSTTVTVRIRLRVFPDPSVATYLCEGQERAGEKKKRSSQHGLDKSATGNGSLSMARARNLHEGANTRLAKP